MARLVVPLKDMGERMAGSLRNLTDEEMDEVILLMNDSFYRGCIAEMDRAKEQRARYDKI